MNSFAGVVPGRTAPGILRSASHSGAAGAAGTGATAPPAVMLAPGGRALSGPARGLT
jgi:hypothetical protein